MNNSLLTQFDCVVVFDTETTGIDFQKDEIIELGAVCITAAGETDCMDDLIRLSPGRTVPPFIANLTGITDVQLAAEGVEKAEAAQRFCRLFQDADAALLVAYNAQFDLNFLYRFLLPFHLADTLRKPRFLDALTVYRDRREYPHKLCNAIEAYQLADAVNSHRAVDDARATVALLDAMAAEQDDLLQYLDLFGTHPKYGLSGRAISSVTYRPQSYRHSRPLYEQY